MKGSYYTDSSVARFLASWAIRSPSDRILEPSFGAGIFLQAAENRLRDLGGLGTVVGIDIDREAWESARRSFSHLRLENRDFFELSPASLGTFDAAIGNPPFIRYHRFRGEARDRALRRVKDLGVEITALASAWAPFIVMAASHLAHGGRLAMVAPLEITYANYARPVVGFLARSFSSIACLTFDEPLFPDLNESTVLLLCDGFGGSTPVVGIHRLSSASALEATLSTPGQKVSADRWVEGTFRPRLTDLNSECADLYTKLLTRPEMVPLGTSFRVTIGYVTGDNAFFHLSEHEALGRGIPAKDLSLAVRRSSDLMGVGLALEMEDAAQLKAHGSHWLFRPPDGLAPGSAAYVKEGEKAGVADRFKCRSRGPWYQVPGVRVPNMIMSVFSNGAPRLVENRAQVVAANSVFTLYDRISDERNRAAVAAASVTTLAQLGAEIEGHILGGGALKFEPYEARRWALPSGLTLPDSDLARIDGALRSGGFSQAKDVADKSILLEGMGLTVSDLSTLRSGLDRLRTLRQHRRTNHAGARDLSSAEFFSSIAAPRKTKVRLGNPRWRTPMNVFGCRQAGIACSVGQGAG